MKTLVQKITWKKMMVVILLVGSAIAGWQIYAYQTRTLLDKVLAFFS